MFQNYWKHRGTENTEEDNCTEKITCQVGSREIALEEIAERLNSLIHFANAKEDKLFIHPVIKAIMLHFWNDSLVSQK